MGYQIAGRSPAFAGEGETVRFPVGEPHRFWNAGSDELYCEAYIEPAGNAEFFLSALFASQKANGGRMPALLDVAYLLRRYRSEYGMYVVPRVVQRLVFPVLVLVGTLLGWYKRYEGAPEPLKQ